MKRKNIEYFSLEPRKHTVYFESHIPVYGWPDLQFSVPQVGGHLLKFRVVQHKKQRKIKRIEVALFASSVNVILPTTNELCWSTNLCSPPCDSKEGQDSGYYFTYYGSFVKNTIGSPDIYIWFEDGEFDSSSNDKKDIMLEVQALLDEEYV